MKYVVLFGFLGVFLLTCGFADGAERETKKNETEAAKKDDSPKPTKAEAAKVKILDRVTVVGSPGRAAEIPGSVYRLGRKELDQQNQAVDDIHRVLLRLPGINIQEEDGYGLRPNIGMRGTGSERSSNITLMEDGVLIAPAPYSAPSAYYFPYVGRMEGVEVRKGSSQIKYGPRSNGGALNLLSTSVPEVFTGRARVALGEDNTRKAHVNYGDSWKRISWLLETYQMESDGFKRLDSGGNTGFDVQDYVGKIRVQSSDDAAMYQEATFKIGYNEQTSNETYLGLTDADFDRDPYRRYAASQRDQINTDHRQFQLRHFILPKDNIDVTTTVYRQDFSRNWYKLDKVDGVGISAILADPASNMAAYDVITGRVTSANDALAVKANNRDYLSRGVETVVGLQGRAGASSHEFEIGVRYHEDEEDRFQHSDGYRIESGGEMVLTTRGAPGVGGGGDNRVNSAAAVAMFLKDDIELGRWTLTPGVRYENIETKRDQYGSGDPSRDQTPTTTKNTTRVAVPGIGVNYAVRERVGVFAGLHRGFAPPGPGADDRTQSESSTNYELGFRVDSRHLATRVLGFFNDYRNLLGKDTFASGGTGSGDLFNGGEVDVLGLEASISGDVMPSESSVSIPYTVSYTFTQAEFKSSFDSSFSPWGEVEAGDELPYIPRHQLSGGVAYDHERWRANIFGNVATKMRTNAGQGDFQDSESTDTRFVLDLSAEYSLNKGARLFASLQNVTDEIYIAARRPAGVRPGLPRQLTAGLKLDL